MKRSIILIMAAALLASSCGTSSGVRASRSNEIASIEIASSYSDVYSFLNGRVPGLYIDGRSLSIRGSDVEPLIIYDGVRMYDLDAILPMDIYSVKVRSTDAMSIYGMQAEGGALEITSRHQHQMDAAAKKANQ